MFRYRSDLRQVPIYVLSWIAQIEMKRIMKYDYFLLQMEIVLSIISINLKTISKTFEFL